MPWVLTDHACRHCFGRVLKCIGTAAPLYRCAECGAEHAGRDVGGLCWCGVEVPGVGRPYRCERSSLGSGPQVVVREVTDVETAAKRN